MALFMIYFNKLKKLEFSKELMLHLIACASSQWAHVDKSSWQNIYLYCGEVSTELIHAQKTQSLLRGRTIYRRKNSYAFSLQQHDLIQFSFNDGKSTYASIWSYPGI